MVADALLGRVARFVAHVVFAGEVAVEQTRALHPFVDHPLDAVLIDFDARQAVVILLVHPLCHSPEGSLAWQSAEIIR